MRESPVHIIGASGRSGLALYHALRARGVAVTPVVRNRQKWSEPDAIVADLTNPRSMTLALSEATRVVSCAHARHAPAVIAAAPTDATFVFLGSTRKFTQWPDDHGNGVLAGEAAFTASGRFGVMLHPTMIYGAQGENNVQRLAAVLARLPVVPLPKRGASLVQPIHQEDVTRAMLAALDRTWDGPHSLTIAGPAPVSYGQFIQAIAAAAGLRMPRILSFPIAPLIVAAALSRFLPGLPTIQSGEIRRLLEDKAFDIGPMRELLGIEPMSLQAGLARTFRTAHDP